MVNGAGFAGFGHVGFNGAAQEPGDGVGCGIEFGIGYLAPMNEVGRAEEVDDALDGAGLVEVSTGIEIAGVAGDAEEGDEMAACGAAPDADAALVDTVFFGMDAEPADGGFAIFDLGGEDGVLAEAVFDAGGCVTEREQGARGAIVLVACGPSAAVYPDDERKRGGGLLGEIKVDLLPGAAIGDVGKVAEDANSGRSGTLCLRNDGKQEGHEER